MTFSNTPLSTFRNMDMIREYESDGKTTSSSNDELGPRQSRQVYLVTYSQADRTKFPTRHSFAEAVVASFSSRSAVVLHWCCSEEKHKKSGTHYHMCVKLDRVQRWMSAKAFLLENYSISVHFSSKHINYYSAWKYVTKEDEQYQQSENHPDLTNEGEPRTTRAHEALGRRRTEGVQNNSDLTDSEREDEAAGSQPSCSKPRGKKRKRLTAFEVSEIIVSKHLNTRTELLAFANSQRTEGKTDLAEFLVNRGTRVVNELIETTWEMQTAKAKMDRSRKSRMELLYNAYEADCICDTTGEWRSFAMELLNNNNIARETFTNSIKTALEKGRGKYRNVMLTGPTNCGKTFLLNPLNKIYETFTNPASTSFAWVGAEKAEIVFLNDFRWSPQIIPWHDLLLMLEGQLVHLPAPKSHFAKDITFYNDTPIFATSKQPLAFVKHGILDDRETEMMTVRWNTFNLYSQIPGCRQKEVNPCPACFASFILDS